MCDGCLNVFKKKRKNMERNKQDSTYLMCTSMCVCIYAASSLASLTIHITNSYLGSQ